MHPTNTESNEKQVFTEENPRFYSENGEIFDKIHGGNLPIAEIVWLLNSAEIAITSYREFEGKLKWACKALPSNRSKRGFEG